MHSFARNISDLGTALRHLRHVLPVLPAARSVRVVRPPFRGTNEKSQELYGQRTAAGTVLRRAVLSLPPHRQQCIHHRSI